MTDPAPDRLGPLLERARAGDASATETLLPLVYDELRRIAARLFRSERGDHTLQPTALVHEAFVKLLGSERPYDGRRHFLIVAAKAMRQVLADHARARRAQKRGGERERVSLAQTPASELGPDVDLVGLDDALRTLAERNPRAAEVVELRFFAGLTVDEVAETLALSDSTIEADWRVARAWLRARLAERSAEA